MWLQLATWFDTVFFGLRKKWSHVTFVHLYYHSASPLLGYFAFRTNPFIPAFLLLMVCNSVVHVLMYSYFAMSTYGPEVTQKYLWWKKLLVQIQFGQLLTFLGYAMVFLLLQNGYPDLWFNFVVLQMPVFIASFLAFIVVLVRKEKKQGDINNCWV